MVKAGCGVGREVLCLQSHPARLACAKISKIFGSDQIRCLTFFVFGLMYKGVWRWKNISQYHVKFGRFLSFVDATFRLKFEVRR